MLGELLLLLLWDITIIQIGVSNHTFSFRYFVMHLLFCTSYYEVLFRGWIKFCTLYCCCYCACVIIVSIYWWHYMKTYCEHYLESALHSPITGIRLYKLKCAQLRWAHLELETVIKESRYSDCLWNNTHRILFDFHLVEKEKEYCHV